MPELMIRQILPRGQKPVYGFVDLGVKENMARGQSAHVLQRDMPPDGDKPLTVMFITFLPDTLHNRASLISKNASKGELEIYFQGGEGEFLPLGADWVEKVFGPQKSSKLSAPAPKKPKAVSKAPAPGSTAVPVEATQTTSGAPVPSAPPAVGKIDAAAAAASLKQFMDLPLAQQMSELDGDVPEEFLKALVASADPKMKTEVQDKAFTKLSAMG